MKATTITSLRTGDKTTFVNDLSLEQNLINQILIEKGQTGQLLNKSVREKITAQFPVITSISTKTGKPFAYCELMELHAKFD